MAQNSIDNSIVNATLSQTLSSAGQWNSYSDGTDTFGFYNYAGSPEGNVAANIGSRCVDTTNGALYIKISDTVNTGWEILQSSSRSGEILQVVYAEITSGLDITAQIPSDGTIPQISEGTEIFTVAITPTNSSNYLLVNASLCTETNGTQRTIALFRSDDTDAFYAQAISAAVNHGDFNVRITAGTTSSINISARGGTPNGGGAEHLYVNRGSISTNTYGGVRIGSLTVMEVQA